MDLAEYEALEPSIEVPFGSGKLVFATPSRRVAWRVETLFSKEPDTVEWINEFAEDEVFLDVGANIGLYSVLAAARGARVHAFEPESQNYALLNRNIFRNGLGERVVAYCAALSDRAEFSKLYLSSFKPAGSCHSFGAAVDFREEPMVVAFEQGSYSSTVDGLVASGAMPVPAHLKIDVDGFEHKVIAGAAATLQDRRLRSVLIEVNTNLESHWAIVDLLMQIGFDYSREQLEAAQRKDGMFEGVGNIIFRR